MQKRLSMTEKIDFEKNLHFQQRRRQNFELVSCGKWPLSTAQEQIFQAGALLKAVMARIAKFSPRSRIFGFVWFESLFNKLVMNYQIKI
jgi:hypothetical protein